MLLLVESFLIVGSHELKSDIYDSLWWSVLLFFLEFDLDITECFLDTCLDVYLDGLGVFWGWFMISEII